MQVSQRLSCVEMFPEVVGSILRMALLVLFFSIFIIKIKQTWRAV
jgi:hypothetical protein